MSNFVGKESDESEKPEDRSETRKGNDGLERAFLWRSRNHLWGRSLARRDCCFERISARQHHRYLQGRSRTLARVLFQTAKNYFLDERVDVFDNFRRDGRR